MNKTVRKLLAPLALTAAWPLFAQTTAPAPQKAGEEDEQTIVLSPFEVTAETDHGYQATQTLAGSRINTKLEDVGSAISVVTPEFLKDVGATDNKSLLGYTTNTEVGGTQGNFRNASGGQTQDESYQFQNPNASTRVRGLTAADNTRNFFVTDIPWDGYNVERIDMQRGPNSILFGLGSPAGIINATTRTAQHRTFGEVEMRYGSFGTNRVSLDVNYDLLPKELALRIDVLRNDEKYKQDPAYSLDKRVFGTLRYDPKFLAHNGNKTTVKVSYEVGSVRSNNPRTITPTDAITPWWDKLNKATYNPATVQNSGLWYYTSGANAGYPYHPANMGQYNSTYSGDPTKDYAGNTIPSTIVAQQNVPKSGSANPYYQPWLGAPSMYGGVWMQYDPGQTTAYSTSMPEYKDVYGINSSGAIDGGIGGHPFARRVTVATTNYWSQRDSTAPWQSWGVWKNKTLSDPSVFDFFNKLIDGNNKREWQNFHNFNASLTQTFLDDKFGFELAYDQQRYRRGQYSFNGSGTLYIDINAYNLDGTPNKNVGRPYIETNNVYGNSATDVWREASRLSAFFNQDFDKNRNGGWLRKLLGRHTISGLLSQDMYKSDARSFMRYGTPDSFGSLVATGTNASYIDSNDRVVATTVYLGNSLLNTSTSVNANIPNAGDPVQVPTTAQFRYFNSTWNATGVNPADPWVSTYNGQKLTQSENPANYVGWTTTPVNILSAERGDQDALTYGATLNKRVVDSAAAVWQAHFWNDSIVGMYGIRNDRVMSWAYDGTRVNDRVDFTAKDPKYPNLLQYSTGGKAATVYKANSPSWSVVTKLNKLVGDWLPINISLFYNESRNFQVAGTRNNIYGQALPLPSGRTKDFGIMLSDKEDRFELKINKYKSTVKDATNTTGIATWFLLGGGNFIQRNEDRADAYEYHLANLGDPKSANGTGSWTWQYTPKPGQTQADADAEAAAAVAGWRAYTAEPIVQRILKAWGFNDFSVTQLTTMSTPVSNFVATEDQVSKGYEYELTANPTRNWRISVNASDTRASRSNIGGKDLQEFIDLTNKYENGPMGDIRQWGGGAITSTSLVSWNSNFYASYLLMKLQEGSYATELRRWRYNVVSNYTFSTGKLKGFNVGAGYRWQDKVIIGYPVSSQSTTTKLIYDLAHPYYGPRQEAVDLWLGYEHRLTSKINWRVQLNVRNVGQGNKLIPLSAEYDGTIAAWGIAPSQTWTLTNDFSF